MRKANDCECTCTDMLELNQSNKKYKLVTFAIVAIVGLILIFDNPGNFSS